MNDRFGGTAIGVIKASALATLLAGCAAAEGPARPATVTAPAAPADITINGQLLFSESITSDRAGNIYVGSIPGDIYRATPGSAVAEKWITADAHNGLLSLFGVLADDRHGLLWACSNPNPFSPGSAGRSALKAFDLAKGSYTASYDLPEGRQACNDIAVGPDGSVFASETFGGQIFRLPPNGNELELFAKGEELVGIDGLAFAADGTLYINNVRHHLFQRVERKTDGSYAGLKTLETDLTLAGPDGIRAVADNHFIQAEGQNGRVALISVEGDKATVTPLFIVGKSTPAVTLVGNVAYAIEGKIQYLFDPALKGQDPGAFMIRAARVELPR